MLITPKSTPLVHLNSKPLIRSPPRRRYLNGREVGLLPTHPPKQLLKLEACRPSGLPLLFRTPQQSSSKACRFYLLTPFQIHLSPSVHTATSLFTCVASHLRHSDSFLSGLPASSSSSKQNGRVKHKYVKVANLISCLKPSFSFSLTAPGKSEFFPVSL